MSRRDVLKTAAAGAGAGLLPSAASAQIVSSYPANKWGTPGLYPGRVIAMFHSGSSLNFQYQTGAIQQMIRSGLMKLTGMTSYVAG